MNNPKKLLCELIALPSVNPRFLAANHRFAGEHRVADFLAATAAVAGLDVDFQEVLPNRRNLLARLTPPGKISRRILLAPHLDTVNVAHEAQFSPVESKGRIYGRGACDTKGSVAAMFLAVCELAKKGWGPAGTEIIFAGLVDEEVGQAGSRTLAASGFQADLAIIGEPTLLKVVTAHKGGIYLQLETKGKSAHGSCPHLGRNAVLEMAKIVQLLEQDYAHQLRGRRHPLLGHPTISVGLIEGGVQPNIVPSSCRITADRRTLPGENWTQIHAEIRTLLKKNGVTASIRNTRQNACLPMETDTAIPLVKQFMGAMGQRKPMGVNYFCDAAVISKGGTPSVVFGPGNISQAHTDDEWISLASLERGTAMLVQFLKNLN